MRDIFISIVSAALLSGIAMTAHSQDAKASAEKAISVFPNEKLYVEIITRGESNIEAKTVATLTNKINTMTFELTSVDGGKGMMLTIHNPLKRAIKYHLDMVDRKGKLHQTSSCAVAPGLSVFETWPHPIPEIRVTDIHFVDSDKEMNCVY